MAWAAKVNAQLAEGAPTALAFRPVDLRDLISRWLDRHEQVRRSSVATVQRYKTAVGHLANFASSTGGNVRVDRFTSNMAEEFVRYLRTTRVTPNGHPNTRKRVMRDKRVVFILGTCRALFNFAREHRHLPAYAGNPFSGMRIEPMSITTRKLIVLTVVAGIVLLANAGLIAKWLEECSIIEFAAHVRSEFLTGTALTVIIILFVFVGRRARYNRRVVSRAKKIGPPCIA